MGNLQRSETGIVSDIADPRGLRKAVFMAKIIKGSTPKQDGFYMPGEYAPQEKVWMIWPERADNWRLGAKPAQEAYADVAKAISEFTPVTMLVSYAQYRCV